MSYWGMVSLLAAEEARKIKTESITNVQEEEPTTTAAAQTKQKRKIRSEDSRRIENQLRRSC